VSARHLGGSLAPGGRPGKRRARVSDGLADLSDECPILLISPTSTHAGALVMVKAKPWNVGDRQLLIGDAAHSVVPFYGQVSGPATGDSVRRLERVADACPTRDVPRRGYCRAPTPPSRTACSLWSAWRPVVGTCRPRCRGLRRSASQQVRAALSESIAKFGQERTSLSLEWKDKR
jgi:hypothetical protein